MRRLGAILAGALLASAAVRERPIAMSVGAPERLTVLTGNVTWPAGAQVALRGTVRIGAGADWRVGAGTIVRADPGARIIVERDARLDLQGTLLEPIVFACADGATEPGCWDGIAVHGHAPLNHGTGDSPAGGRGGAGGCRQSLVDGVPYGGCTSDDSSGVMRFVRVQYAQRGLRLLGVGRRSVFEDVQVHRSLGNGLEVIGGTAQLRRVALTTNAQFGLSYSGGWTGRLQFGVIQQDPTGFAGGVLGRNAVTARDDPLAVPQSNPRLVNLTVVTPSDPQQPYAAARPPAFRFERGGAVQAFNTLLVQPATMLDIDGDASCAAVTVGELRFFGIVAVLPASDVDPDTDGGSCGGDGAEQAVLASASLVRVDDPAQAAQELLSPVDVVLPDLRPRVGSVTLATPAILPGSDGFTELAGYHGAVASAGLTRSEIPWYSGWTVGEALPPPGLGTILGQVVATGIGGVASTVRAVPSGVRGTSAPLGAFELSGVPAGPVELVAEAIPSGCRATSRFVHVRAGATVATVLQVDCAEAGPAPRRLGAGDFHTCVLDGAGRPHCWGRNRTGQLGVGDTLRRTVPTAVATTDVFVSLAAGAVHTCGLRHDGAAFCWGSNSVGQLGDGTLARRLAPVAVNTSRRFVQLVAGGDHTCGLEADGTATCWGGNASGELGDGGVAQRTAPFPVTGGVRWLQLAAGSAHTCGLDAAARPRCWGENSAGQLGDGQTVDRGLPDSVRASGPRAVVATGGFHTCAVTAAGSPACWGFNAQGQLGDGTRTGRVLPTLMTGSAMKIALGSQHSCLLDATGIARCFGNNADGQVGDGTTDDALHPVAVAGSGVYAEISAGLSHTCAIDAGGSTWCWGGNLDGQLGDGTTTRRLTPTPVGAGVGQLRAPVSPRPAQKPIALPPPRPARN